MNLFRILATAILLIMVSLTLSTETLAWDQTGGTLSASSAAIPRRNATYHSLAGGPLTQNWSNTNLITSDDDWSAVPSIIGYRGDSGADAVDVDPQTILADTTGTPVDVHADEVNPAAFFAGGLGEFHLPDPVVAFQGSITADAPFLLIHLNTVGVSNVQVSYTLRDIDDNSNDAVQQVALHYRIGTSGNFTNVPAAYVADASNGPNLTKVTPVNVTLPATVAGRSQLQLRVMTTNASSFDELIGIDDIVISATPDSPPTVVSTVPTNNATGVGRTTNISLNFSENVSVNGDWFQINCPQSGVRRPGLGNVTISGGPKNYTLNPTTNFAYDETCSVILDKDLILDQDGAADKMGSDYTFTFTTELQNADLSLTVAVDETAPLERDKLTYTIQVSNRSGSNSSASGVVIAATLPDVTTYLENISNSCGATIVGNTLTWAVGNLAVGAQTSCTLNATVRVGSNGATFALLAEVSASDTPDLDSTPGNLSGAPAEDDEGQVSVTVSGVSALCGDPATLISTIQGEGALSPEAGNSHTIEGVVVGDFQEASQLAGFFVQEEAVQNDGNPLTSEGIFVFDDGFGVEVTVGEGVRLTGEVFEWESAPGSGVFLTELRHLSRVIPCAGSPATTSTTINLPLNDVADWEQYEGMAVTFTQPLYITDNAELGQTGSVLLAEGGPLLQPTQVVLPGAAAINQQTINERRQILLDDGSAQLYPDPLPYPPPGLSGGNSLRSGDMVSNLSGVVDQRFGRYRLQPVGVVNIQATNPRPVGPVDLPGRLKIASFNLDNYFNTFVECQAGVAGVPTACRGAESDLEFSRQREKIGQALLGLEADIVGLVEVENDGYGPTSALQDLVNGVNEALGVEMYALLDVDATVGLTNTLGTDAIKNALIYKPATVMPVGPPATITTGPFAFHNRPPLAQTFEEVATGEQLTVVINHFKSKATSTGGPENEDSGDGQGLSNGSRVAAAQTLLTWLETNPTGSTDPDLLVLGDLNAYAKEDPLQEFFQAGYTNLVELFNDETTATYSAAGQWGSLDYALSNGELTSQIFGVMVWSINAAEPRVLDYREQDKSPAQVALYQADAYRASDHDPIIVGLSLGEQLNPSQRFVYLPLVVKPGLVAPDLVVEALIAASEAVTVVVKNQGNGPVLDAFWVDVYINPYPQPTMVNQPWHQLSTQGMVWGGNNLTPSAKRNCDPDLGGYGLLAQFKSIHPTPASQHACVCSG